MSDTRDVQTHEKQEAQTPEGVERMSERQVYVPRADISETEETLQVVLDMPGVDEAGLDLTLEKDVLTVRGSVDPQVPEGYSPIYLEYESGDYERAFTLGREIDQERIEASLRDGVLTVTLPKAGPARTRKIEVKAAS
jgi:HSP20 family protein